MLVMSAVSTQTLPLIQTGASAVLVVALQSPETDSERILDALVGGGVALVVSQLLLPPSPVSLLRAADREALCSIAKSLRASARAHSDGDVVMAETALERLREEGLNSTADFCATREMSGNVASRTLRGRRTL